MRQQTATVHGELVKSCLVIITASCVETHPMEKKVCQAELHDIRSDINANSICASSLDVRNERVNHVWYMYVSRPMTSLSRIFALHRKHCGDDGC